MTSGVSYRHCQVLVRLAELPLGRAKACIVADRYRMLTEELYFDHVIRVHGNIMVTSAARETGTAAERVQGGGRAVCCAPRSPPTLPGRYRGLRAGFGDEANLLATSSTHAGAKRLTGYSGRRWAIECSFRDTKDLRFAMGLGTTHLKSPERRNRLWLINAFAVALLMLVGAAGDALGYNRMLKATRPNGVSTRCFARVARSTTSSRPSVTDGLGPLMQRFSQMLQEPTLFADAVGQI